MQFVILYLIIMSKKYSIILLIVIVILALAAGFFVFPKNYGAKLRPWKLGLDLVGGTHLIYEADMSQIGAGDRDSVMSGLKEVIERRVNLFGVSEPRVTASKTGESYRLIVELAGIKDIGEAVNQIGATPFLEFRKVVGAGTSTKFIATGLTGRYLKSAKLDFEQQTIGAPFLSLEFNDEGAKMFEDITAKNVGQRICTFIDGQPADCATVQEKISGGKARITGKFTTDEVKQMANRFNAGALPAPIILISQQVVGANLGQESLKLAIKAGVIGTILIMLFMIIYYRKFGIIASLALLFYIILTLAVFKGLGITMTLAGIAGFILSIGMAVDANILVFERTKEEIKKGISRLSAIEEGFKRAWLSIRDSNVSTIITSIILYYLTTSFVKGFALTLLIGVLISMFSAITITRTMLRVFVKSPE